MNITLGKSTRWNNGPASRAIIAAGVAVAVLAGVGIWQAKSSDSSSTVAPAAVNQPGIELGGEYSGIGRAYIDSRAGAFPADVDALENSLGLGQAGEGSRVLAPQLTLDAELSANPSLGEEAVRVSAPALTLDAELSTNIWLEEPRVLADVAPQFSTAADADYVMRGLNSQPVVSGEFYAPADFYGIGQPDEAVKTNMAPLIDPTDFGSLGIESALQPQFSTAADAVYAAQMLGEDLGSASVPYVQPEQVSSNGLTLEDYFGLGLPGEGVVDPHFGTGVESISVLEGFASF